MLSHCLRQLIARGLVFHCFLSLFICLSGYVVLGLDEQMQGHGVAAAAAKQGQLNSFNFNPNSMSTYLM